MNIKRLFTRFYLVWLPLFAALFVVMMTFKGCQSDPIPSQAQRLPVEQNFELAKSEQRSLTTPSIASLQMALKRADIKSAPTNKP